MYEDQDEWVVYDPVSLGRALAHYRAQAGLTQDQLAGLAGLHRPYLSGLEGGKKTEQTERLFRLLRRLDLEVVVRPRRSS